MLKGKTVVVGVCGGIAAYKVVEVVSRLKKLHACVHVIMTGNALKFVAPLTFQSLSHNPVITDMFAEPMQWDVEHIALARKADIMVIAPATANIIGKAANGIADDMLTTTLMATRAPVLFVPAMNPAMFENAIFQGNMKKLEDYGYEFMQPDTGIMAAEGEYGKGRLPEPVSIVENILVLLRKKQDMQGLRMLVTSGPTREAIDPVRYISNHSSGKMGYALAEAASARGAQVTLVSGPVSLAVPSGVDHIKVITAQEMYQSVLDQYKDNDILIMVAAVADYRCEMVSSSKIKKTSDSLTLKLVKNPDIAKTLGKIKENRILVGFSAETDHLEKNAKIKLESKNLDLIVANDVTMDGAGFGTDTNIVKLIRRDGSILPLPIMSKAEVSGRILDEIMELRLYIK